MREHELERLRQRLIQERQEQYEKIERFEAMNKIDYNQGKELSLYDNHPAEIGSETYEMEKNMALKQQQVANLKDIEETLKNMDNGRYGICQGCGQEIPIERLEAAPTASTCINCQDDSEQQLKNASDEDNRPIEERFLYPPYARTNLDDADSTAYDGEDTWQDVAKYNKTENMALDWYDNNFYDHDETDAGDDPDNITNEQYIEQLSDD